MQGSDAITGQGPVQYRSGQFFTAGESQNIVLWCRCDRTVLQCVRAEIDEDETSSYDSLKETKVSSGVQCH